MTDSDGSVESAPQWAGYAGHEQDEDDNEYATPPEIWRPLADAVDGFDVDPASGAEPTPIAPVRYTKDDDGLSQAWEGDVFLNPPWSSNGDGEAKRTWLRKARNEGNREDVDTVTVLLPADTGSHVFHDHITEAPVFCLVGPGRIPFIGEDRNPSFDLAIAVYGDPPDALVDVLDSLGVVVRGGSVYTLHEQRRLVTDGGRAEHDSGVPQLRTESPYGDTPDEDVSCADCGKYSLMAGPVSFDGEVVENGDFVCVPCALRRGVDLDQ